jgi:hypothetical protein
MLSWNHIKRALSERSSWPNRLAAIWHTLQPDRSERPMLVQQHLCGRPRHEVRGMREADLGYPQHPRLLRYIRRDAEKPQHSRMFSHPLT